MAREGTYCSTCGSSMAPGRRECDVCGATDGYLPSRPRGVTDPVPTAPHNRPVALGTCHSCGYRGEGIRYFSTGKHIAGLILAALLTSWLMGVGGLVYYLFRRDYRACPRCGQSWGPGGQYALSAPGYSPPPAPMTVLPESSRRGWSFFLFLFAAILIIGGLTSGEVAALGFGAVSAAGGVLLYQAAQREREDRRRAMIATLQLPVLQLAEKYHGRLTVTQVAAHLGWTLPRAEKVLHSLDDGFRVNSEVTDEGVIVYEFRELIGPDRRLQGPG